MFKKIYVPVDNSEYSNKAIEMALALATPWNAASRARTPTEIPPG